MNGSNKRQVVIIDYGAGNLRSVANAVAKLDYQPVVTADPDKVLTAPAVMLPGVGAAADTMRSLKKLGMDEVIRQLVREKRHLFAICIGMQILLSETEEGGRHSCLGLIPGTVRKLPPGLKVPHMGWNQVRQKLSHPIFSGIPDDTNFYFVHSYFPDPTDTTVVAGTTDYGVSFCSALIKDNLVATQFHPEKSGEYGLKMYANFLETAYSENPQ